MLELQISDTLAVGAKIFPITTILVVEEVSSAASLHGAFVSGEPICVLMKKKVSSFFVETDVYKARLFQCRSNKNTRHV